MFSSLPAPLRFSSFLHTYLCRPLLYHTLAAVDAIVSVGEEILDQVKVIISEGTAGQGVVEVL